MFTDKDLKFNPSDAKQKVFYKWQLCSCSFFSFIESLMRFWNDVVQTIGFGFCDSFIVGSLNLFVQVLVLTIISSTIGLRPFYCA